jgi:hypothetical protein
MLLHNADRIDACLRSDPFLARLAKAKERRQDADRQAKAELLEAKAAALKAANAATQVQR